MLAGAAAMTAVRPVWAQDGSADFYDNALVIDALCPLRRWDDAELSALAKTGYAGIVASLSNRDLQTAIDALVTYRKRVAQHSDKLMIALSADDFQRAKDSRRVAALMNFQNSTMLDGAVDNVDALYALGMRSFQLTYNARNLIGDGCLERTNAGLSDFGVEVVARMNEIGVMVDLSHCGRQTTLDGIAFSKKPVAMTHTMCESIRKGHPRAKTDEQMRSCAEKGGVVGMAALGYFVGDDPGGTTTVETYADHIEHATAVVGYEHVGLSTDFSPQGISPWATRESWYEPRLKSFKPSYEVRWPPWIPELDTPDRYRTVVRVLKGRGWNEGQLEGLLGRNWVRLFRETIG